MGEIRNQRPVLLVTAICSRYEDALQWSRDKMAEHFGPIELQSEVFDFVQTSFYNASMGEGLKKQFLAFATLLDPAQIAATKLFSNQLESQYAAESDAAEDRPLNIDPGYITEAKLVLVTTKDRDHRIYLEQGIYAEVTLFFRNAQWQSSRWTYPDYQLELTQNFFRECRQHLRSCYRSK